MNELTTITWEEKILNIEGTKQTFDVDEKHMETAVFELYEKNKRVLMSCNKHKMQDQIKFAKDNLEFYPDTDLHYEQTPQIQNKIFFGEIIKKEEMEVLYKTMENIANSYENIIGYNLFVCYSQTIKKVQNTWGLNLEEINYSKYCFADLFASDGNKNVNHTFYHNLNFPFVEGDFKKEIETYLLPKLNTETIKSGFYNILFNDGVSRYLISKFLKGLFGSAIYRDGYFRNKINTKILPEGVIIWEKPKSINYAVEYDDYGVALKNKKIVENGILNQYFINREYGQKLKMPVTGNSFFTTGNSVFTESWTNIFVEAKMEDFSNFSGLFIDTILSTNLNNTNGDFVCSISGFYMQNGVLEKSFVNGSLSFNISTFTSIKFGGEVYNKDTIFTPQILMENVFISGVE